MELSQARSQELWQDNQVMIFSGIADTNLNTGEDYVLASLSDIFTLPAAAQPKSQAPALIPSSYNGHDGRSHNAQREHGRYGVLTVDIDKGNVGCDEIHFIIHEFLCEVGHLIYSTSSATPDDKRWRVLIPLQEPLPFADWHDFQTALHDHFVERGIQVDRSMARAAQAVFLPNVPPERRDADGHPLYYDHVVHDGRGASMDYPPVARAIEAIRSGRLEDERKREDARDAAARRRAEFQSAPRDGQRNLIDEFNAKHSITDLLAENGYEQSPRNDRDWQSPHQSSGSYATRTFQSADGSEYWISLSESDAEAGLGVATANNCRYGDAFDLFVHFEHGGDFNAALKTATALRTKYDAQEQAGAISATPYEWRDPASIPPRPWLCGHWLLLGTVACVIAPGGTGKSTFVTGMALSIATGRDILGKTIWPGRQRVWVWNLEDDLDELSRSIQAAIKLHGIEPGEIRRDLFVDSALDGSSLCTALEDRSGMTLLEPVYEELTAELIRRGIKALVVDPFVSSHAVEENSNSKIDKIVKAWARVGKDAGCVIILVHHTSKAGSAEVNANSSRGASALTSAARTVLTLNRMTNEEAGKFGIPDEDRRRYIVVNDDKHNRAPAESGAWFEIVSVDLGNDTMEHRSDSVGALRQWKPPVASGTVSINDMLAIQNLVDAGEHNRESDQSPNWVGHAVASVLGLDVSAPSDKFRIKAVLRQMFEDGYLGTETRNDRQSKPRQFVVCLERPTLNFDPPDGWDLI